MRARATASGTIRAFYKALDSYGTIKWKKAIEPAAKYAEEGYTVSEKQAILWRLLGPVFGFSMRDKYSANPFAEKIFLKNGEPYNVGEKLVQSDLGKTLRIIGQEGPEEFYTGTIGRKITKDLEENGSLVKKEDWEDYELRESKPLKTKYRDFTVSTNPAPGGGITLIEMLNILEGYDLNQYDWINLGPDAVEHMHLVAMAFKAAQIDRSMFAQGVIIPLITHIINKM